MLFGKQSDKNLICKALEGSERSWLTLVKRYESRVYNYALRLSRNQDDAMELMQEVFLSVYRNLANFRGDSSFSTWLFRIAANRSTDMFRKQQRTPEGCDKDLETIIDDQSPTDELEMAQQNYSIRKLMASLPEDQRIVIELKFFQHFSFDEIAQQTGISPNTAKSRLYAALKKLRQTTEVKHVI